MFAVCTDPSLLSGFDWFACYLTTPKHLTFFGSFFLVLLLIVVVAPLALGHGGPRWFLCCKAQNT